MEKLKVNVDLALKLVKSSWVESTKIYEETEVLKDGKLNYHFRLIVHLKKPVSTFMDYQKLLSNILNDSLFADKDFSLDKQFHKYCMYLSYIDENKNKMDIIVSHPWNFKDKAKLYSEIAGCEMTSKTSELSFESWSCKT